MSAHCRSLGEIGRLGSSVSKQMDAEVTSVNGAAPKEHSSAYGGFALSAPNLFGSKLSTQHHGSTVEPKLGEESNGSSDPDLSLTNKVHVRQAGLDFVLCHSPPCLFCRLVAL